MSDVKMFKLPDVGEGLTEADIVTWHVKVGDTVKVNDVVVEIETAKSLVELPVPFAGTVSALHVAEGDTVEVGTPIISVDDGVGGPAAPAAPAAPVATEPAASTPARYQANVRGPLSPSTASSCSSDGCAAEARGCGGGSSTRPSGRLSSRARSMSQR